MYSYGGLKNKVSRYGWDEYEPYDDEPISRRDFGLSPELEDELMDNAVFLKKRVWRQMKKLKKTQLCRFDCTPPPIP